MHEMQSPCWNYYLFLPPLGYTSLKGYFHISLYNSFCIRPGETHSKRSSRQIAVQLYVVLHSHEMLARYLIVTSCYFTQRIRSSGLLKCLLFFSPVSHSCFSFYFFQGNIFPLSPTFWIILFLDILSNFMDFLCNNAGSSVKDHCFDKTFLFYC